MGRYLLRRLVTMLLVLLIMVTISFFIMRLAPGGPFSGERTLPPEIEQSLNEKYGYDAPMIVQFGRYVWRAVQGDLGPSTKFKDRTVNQTTPRSRSISVTRSTRSVAVDPSASRPVSLNPTTSGMSM